MKASPHPQSLIAAAIVGGTLALASRAGQGTTALKTKVALKTRYSFVLSLSNGVLTASINGKQVYSRTPSGAVSGDKFYFKFGNYDQHATGGAISTTPFTIVEAYSADVVHQ